MAEHKGDGQILRATRETPFDSGEPCGCGVVGKWTSRALVMTPSLCSLHAAAPALLWALEGLLTVDWNLESGDFYNPETYAGKVWANVRAAIAEARGE